MELEYATLRLRAYQLPLNYRILLQARVLVLLLASEDFLKHIHARASLLLGGVFTVAFLLADHQL